MPAANLERKVLKSLGIKPPSPSPQNTGKALAEMGVNTMLVKGGRRSGYAVLNSEHRNYPLFLESIQITGKDVIHKSYQ